MRKQIISSSPQQALASAQKWLDLESIASVQISSERATHPIESALTDAKEELAADGQGWLAAQSGEQTLRLLFDQPQRINLIHLLFHEMHHARTQEFVLRYSTDNGTSYQEILRQQFTFSPPHTSTQVEDYHVQLEGVTTLELYIIPDINGGSACASLAALKLA